MATELLEKEELLSFSPLIQRGIQEGLISFSEDGNKITYKASKEKTYRYTDPEEKVRAACFVELVTKYQYLVSRIDFEVTVPRRTPNDWADIVVYEDDELKKPFLVVECKRDGVSEAEFEQAIEQAFGNANSLRSKYAYVIAGNTSIAYNVAEFKPSERKENVIADIPIKYGKAPKYKFISGDAKNDLQEVSKDELITSLEKSHDTIWQGGKLAPTTAFDEVCKLLFCKMKDEEETEDGAFYKFQIGTHETPSEVAKRIKLIYAEAKKQDEEVFQEDIRLEDEIVFAVVRHIQKVAFKKTDLDTKGVAFERFMHEFFKGKMGQFFTPREIVEFCVKMVKPQKSDFVLDPACGSGGFLLNTLDFIRKEAEVKFKDPFKRHKHWHDFAKDNLFGIEINDQIARVCKMNMIVHDDGHTNVISYDALHKFEKFQEKNKGFKQDHFDIVLSNPPFGATVKKEEKEEGFLDKFDLGKDKKNQKTEILFVERCIEFAKPNGTICLVLPDGILTNSSLQYVRDKILEKCQILAVISLPQFTFSHYGAGVKSSLVFLKKGKPKTDYPIFMAIAEQIGYDPNGKPNPVNDLNKILEEYRKFEENPANFL